VCSSDLFGMTVQVLLDVCTTSGGATPSPSSPAASQAAPSTAASAEASTAASEAAKAPIKIGSDNFYESKLVGEIYAQVLENAGYTVDRKFGLGSRQERIPAMDAGQVDLVPEYVGSGLGFYDKTKITGDGQKNADALQAALTSKNITVLAIAPGTDTNAFAVRPDTASSMGLAKMSDLAAHQADLKWGLPSDCDTNPLCAGALKDYGITYPPAKRTALGACDVPMAQALQGKAIDVAEFCSTQPAIAQFGFVVLQDDKATQPAENLAPLVRNDYLAKVDKTAFEKVLNDASQKITTEELTKMGVDVAVNHKDVGEVAKAFLQAQGLVK